jgi:hypothetical protein
VPVAGEAAVTTDTPLAASTNRVGIVSLYFRNAGGSPVTYFECVAGRPRRLGEASVPQAELTSLPVATFWRCKRLTRRFAATVTLPDGSFARRTTSVRTPSCARRFKLELPRRVARGRRARVRVVDGWGIGGVRPTLCVTSPRAHRACRGVTFAEPANVVTRHFRATTRGTWRVELRIVRQRVRGSVAVGVRARASKLALPIVLATGDSTMQGVDSFLADDLGDGYRLVSDVRPGWPISATPWSPVAASQVARLRPSTSVVSIGANEGFPTTAPNGARHECCGEPWVSEYARRVRESMVIYRRRGRGRVFWLTIAAPADARRVPIVAAVDAAILRAAQVLAGVRVLRMDLLFSPDGYRESIRYHGRDVRVRERDGIHLNVAGTKIAAEAVAQAMREP